MIREATLCDLENLSNLMLEGHNLHLDNRPDIFEGGNFEVKSYVKSILNNKKTYKYIYEVDSKIVGLIFASIKFNLVDDLTRSRKVAFIEYIIVNKNYQRMGIGTKLYHKLCSEIKKENADAVELCVWGFNKEAIKFYESLGMSIKNMRFESTIF